MSVINYHLLALKLESFLKNQVLLVYFSADFKTLKTIKWKIIWKKCKLRIFIFSILLRK